MIILYGKNPKIEWALIQFIWMGSIYKNTYNHFSFPPNGCMSRNSKKVR